MEEEKLGFFARLKRGLSKSRSGFASDLDAVFLGHEKINDDLYEELEEVLVMGDVGVNTAEDIIEKLKKSVKENRARIPGELKQLLYEDIKKRLLRSDDLYGFEDKKTVIMMVGVNGVGKTTTVGKIAGIYKNKGKKTLVAACDTFRAAANAQLTEWAKRADVPIISSREGTDAASVVFDAVNAAKARGTDILILDTAGRLHNKKNLMDELAKMNRVIDREFPDAVRETWVVLDATTGQNALNQAREFNEVANLTGIVLTKMDGTAKGGIAIAVCSELNIPVKFIGVGEGMEDLDRFNAEEFMKALFETEEKTDIQ